MFGKKTYTLRFKKENLESITAIMNMVGVKGKKDKNLSSDIWQYLDFKANDEQIMKLSNKLDKYNVSKAVIFI